MHRAIGQMGETHIHTYAMVAGAEGGGGLRTETENDSGLIGLPCTAIRSFHSPVLVGRHIATYVPSLLSTIDPADTIA